ncbi:MAG: response regulator [Anaerolineae bacterium]
MVRQLLLIDAEEATSFFLRQALEDEGYQVLWSRTGQEGLGTLAREAVDLVLLERELPDADGLELLQTLRSGDRDGPGVVMIGPGSVGDAVEAMRLGAADYLEKPVDLSILRAAVSRALPSEGTASSKTARSPDGLELSGEQKGPVTEVPVLGGADPISRGQRDSQRARASQRRAEALIRLDNFTLRLLTAESAEEAVAAGLEAALDLAPVGRAAVFLLDASRDEYRLVDQRLFPATAFEERASRRLHSGYGLVQRLREEGEPILLEEDAADPWYRNVVSAAPAVGNGALVPVSWNGELIGVLMVVSHPARALTSSHLAELVHFGSRLGAGLARYRGEASRRAGRKLELGGRLRKEAWRSLPLAALMLDGDGRVVVASRRAERLLGHPTDLAGRSLAALMRSEILTPAEDESARWAPWWEEAEVGGRRLRVSVHPWDAEFGSGSVVLLHDLDVEARLERERDRAGYGSALEAISAMVAHEIRNPLAGIVTGIQHLAGQRDPDEEGHEGLQMILQESLRVKRVIEELLLLSRPVRLQPVPTDLGQTLLSAVETCRPQAESRGSEIETHLARRLEAVRGDPDALQRAFRHLLLVLIAGQSERGSITASVMSDPTDGAGYAEVELRADLAAGTEPASSDGRELGFSVEAGAPLGLAVARRIIEAHEGEIQAEGGPKGVTAFVVRIPLGG